MNSLDKKSIKSSIDEEERAIACGFRNFISFISVKYYSEKKTLKECGKLLGVSETKMRTSLMKRDLSRRNKGPLPGVAPPVKRSVDVNFKVRKNTKFTDPKEAIKTYYEDFLLTTREIAKILEVSQPIVCRLLRKYKIKIRHKGKRV
jgi:hypothetical protein